MQPINYFETFINSITFLHKDEISKQLQTISTKYFKNMIKIKAMKLPYGGWEIKAKGIKKQWIKAYIIDEGFTFKIYWYNSNEFLRWVATIITHELAILYDAPVWSGKDLQIIKENNKWYTTFKDYIEELEIDGPSDVKDIMIKKSLSKKIRKNFL